MTAVRPARLSIAAEPPWAVATAATIASPRPVLPFVRLRAVSARLKRYVESLQSALDQAGIR